ncbi:MAG: MarR family transcriptional regulator [Planctomycetia bacterium]|nr:MarR family transcriptional regulator [Planctomycetia bacterium]
MHFEPASARSSDGPLLDLLRTAESAGIGDLARALGVTATAVRQRLDRLMRAGLVERTTAAGAAAGRGRPAHRYQLTVEGRRSGGDNFRDLALVLWREIRGIRDVDVRRGLLTRVGSALAGLYRDRVSGPSSLTRFERAAELLRERGVSCAVDAPSATGNLPVLTTYSCPYPELAEEDRGICAAERSMLQELVGTGVRLSECRLDGASCCRFTASGEESIGP